MSFKNLNIIPPILQALSKEKYTTPTPIQSQSIPILLEGNDLIGIAQTGTGKTASFVLPILQRMSVEKKVSSQKGTPIALVLAPTRELAVQIGQGFSKYGQFLKFRHTVIFGGVSQEPQVRALSKGVDIIVATPGRLLDLINQGYINLRNVQFFTLDEADRMLDMGFIRDVEKIVSDLPKRRQSLFFSATMPDNVSKLAQKLLNNPERVEVAPQATTVKRIEESVFFVDSENKNTLLLGFLKQSHFKSVLVFTRTKFRADKLTRMLVKKKIKAIAIHGRKTQNQRNKAMQDFKSGRSKVLVATDIAARGIDIDDISHVINYDLPNEPENYVHRIGRTARAGAHGVAYSFCAADERKFLLDIEKTTRIKIGVMEHKYHSEQAKNAVGTAARPPQKKYYGPSRRMRAQRTAART